MHLSLQKSLAECHPVTLQKTQSHLRSRLCCHSVENQVSLSLLIIFPENKPICLSLNWSYDYCLGYYKF